MKKFIVVVALVCLVCTLGMAQEESKVQVFGGYQFTSFDTAGLLDRQNMHGWNTDVAVRLSNHFSWVGDVSASYKSFGSIDGLVPKGTAGSGLQAMATVNPMASIYDIKPKARMYSFQTGPRFTFTKGKVSPFAQMTIGINHLAVSAEDIGGLSIGKNGFGMTLGGGLDLNASRHFSLRLMKFDYMLHRFAIDSSLMDVNMSENLNHFRFATGVIYKF